MTAAGLHALQFLCKLSHDATSMPTPCLQISCCNVNTHLYSNAYIKLAEIDGSHA